MGQLVQLSPEESGKLWYKLSTYENNMYATWRAECLENRAFYFATLAWEQAQKARAVIWDWADSIVDVIAGNVAFLVIYLCIIK